MALLFLDSFDHYATADAGKKYEATAGSFTIGATGRRDGGGCSFPGSAVAPILTKNVPASASFVIGAALKITSVHSSTPRIILALLDAGSVQIDLRTNPGQTFSITRNGTALTGGTSSSAFSLGTFYYVELKVTIANSISAGSCTLRVNGADWINVDTGQDTQATANASANQIRIGGNGASCNFVADDYYICDQSGSTNNDFLGDVRVDALLPDGAGNYQQFTPSTGTDHAALVDETAPNTTDYLTGGAAGTKETLAMGSTGGSGAVYGVQVCNAVSKSDSGTCTVKNLIRSSTTDANGANFSPSTSYAYAMSIHETDPATAAAWTVSGINGMEVGLEVVA